MRIEEEEAAGRYTLEGRTYHFCSKRCLHKFREHPDWYVETGPGQEQEADPD